MSVFGPVRALDVRSIAGPVVDVEVPAGTELLREGAPIGTFFVIRSGTAEVFRDRHHVGFLATGDCFGEINPASGESQGYAVITSSPTRLMTFSSFGIARLCDAIPGARERIVERLPSSTGELHSLAEASVRSRAAAASG
jgi:CRP-like cAMP-binding protein